MNKRELRRIFNDGGYLDRLHRGELALGPEPVEEHHPSPPLAAEPFCTRSQLLEYISKTGKRIALVHQYLRPDGTIGLSGLPDPKGVLDKGVWYQLDPYA